MSVAGFVTEAGTERYRQRHATCHPEHFRRLQNAWVSSLGLGTYLGDPDDATDRLYAEAIETALLNGINLLDTAINYRCQRSERVIGEVLERLIGAGSLARDEVIVCTKGGYVPFDTHEPRDLGRYLLETFLEPGLIAYEELVAGCHCLAPRYLEHQLTTSLKNLRLETIDVYYLHNPEQQLEEVSRETFLARMTEAFRLLERKVHDGSIRWYGTATWNGYRANPQQADYLSLTTLLELAQRVGGESHHFRVIQLPYNLSMPEALVFKNQPVDHSMTSVLEIASTAGLSVISSASLLQSRLSQVPTSLHRYLPGVRSDPQRAIQFVRSTPGITAALVGMKQRRHVEENLEVAQAAPLSAEQITQLFTRRTR